MHVTKKYNVFFLFTSVAFEESYPYDTHSDMNLVPSTTDLTHAPYNLFGKLLFSHFHTEPHSREELFQKSKSFILQYTE